MCLGVSLTLNGGASMSISAYRQSMKDTSSPRELERRVFQQVTQQLEVAGRGEDRVARIRAVARNRQLWSTLVADLGEQGNMLPAPLRANLISLGLWVDRYSGQALQSDRPLAPLVDVNRAIIQGLSDRRPG